VLTIGVPLELLLYSKDWWHPKTITGTAVGVEDVIYSIGNGGYMAGLFGGLFPTLRRRQGSRPGWSMRLLPLAVMLAVPLLLFYAFGLHSFTAVSIGTLLALAIMLVARPDARG
jgi:hypothetical protein